MTNISSSPVIRVFTQEDWALHSAEAVHMQVEAITKQHARCSVFLTGGRSARSVYNAWRGLPSFKTLSGVDFFYGDERCSPYPTDEKNHLLAMETLFQDGVPPTCSVHPADYLATDIDQAARTYEEEFPASLDVLLLSVGEDGHIASIFSQSPLLFEMNRLCLPVTNSPKPPSHRVSLTAAAIKRFKSIFLFAQGSAKAAVLRASLANDPGCVPHAPVSLVSHGTWLLDTPL